MKITKKFLLDLAEVSDAFRVVPRVILIFYGILIWTIATWFMGLPVPTTEQSALVVTLVGASAAVIGLYQSSGRKWGGKSNE